MHYVIEDEYIIDLDVQLRQLPKVDMELVLPVIAIGRDETPEISEIEFGSVTTNSIDLSFSTSVEIAQEAVKGIIYSENSDPTFESDSYKIDYGTGRFDMTITGLRNNTTYFFKPYALSNFGFAYGNAQSCQTNPSPIPSEYQLVDYLYASGGAYIDTGLKPTRNSRWILDVKYYSGGNYQMGLSASSGDRFVIVSENSILYIGMGNGLSTGINIANNRYTFEIDSSNNRWGINGSYTSFTSTFVGDTSNLYLFARNQAGSLQFPATAELYNSKMYTGGIFESDMYPVYRKSDNECGMYDIIRRVFCPHIGGGVMTPGPDKEWDE